MTAITVLTAVIIPLDRQILLFLRSRLIVQHNTDRAKPITIATKAKGTISSVNFAISAKTSPYIERMTAMTLKIIIAIGIIFFIKLF